MKVKARRFSQKDIETRVSWINNPKIHNTMYFDLPATVELTSNWFKSIQTNKSRVDFSFTNDDEVVAMGGLTGVSEEHRNAEFYIMVHPEKHGLGIGKEASQWIYNYGFSVLDLHKIYLYTNDDNVSAFHIYERAGFVLEGVMREHKNKDGQFHNRRFYGLLKSEWEKQSWSEAINHAL